MTGRQDEATRRETAALWYTELQDPGVSPDTWEAFLKWESDPANAAAYREIEAALGVIDRTSLSRPGSANPGRGRKPLFLALAGAAATLAIGAAVLSLQAPRPEPAPLAYATAVGERQEVTLEDGSLLTLNTNTQLAVSYSKAERLVRLAQGEVLFEVAHSTRPFLVEAGGTRTRALGTEFDVHAKGKGVSVTLLKGSVRVTALEPRAGDPEETPSPDEALAKGILLKPGDRLDLRPGAPPEIKAVDISSAGKWRDGIIQFDNVTLAEAVEEMNRYSTIHLRIDDEALTAERISGTFPAGKQDEFAGSLKLYLPVEAHRTGDVIVITPAHG